MKHYVQVNEEEFLSFSSEKEAKNSVKGVNGFYHIYSKKELKEQLHKIKRALNKEKAI